MNKSRAIAGAVIKGFIKLPAPFIFSLFYGADLAAIRNQKEF
jgi:hypothetical protein